MKILHLIYDHPDNPWVGGGAAVRAYEISKRLVKQGFDVTIVSGKFKHDFNNDVKNGIKYIFLGNDKNYIISVFAYAYYARKFIEKNFLEYDLIIEDFAQWNPLFAYMFQKRIPVVLELHHKEGKNIIKKYNILGLPFYLIEHFCPRRFSNVISVSENTKRKFNISYARLISNGIDNKLLNFPKNCGGEYVLFLGRIDYHNKGLDVLIKNRIELPIKIVGKGKDEKHLLKHIKKRNNIEYLGFVDNKTKYFLMKNAKFIIMPSRYEGQGIVAIEAGALGKPVIVSDIPELRYVVENGFGLSFRRGSAENLKKKIEFLWDNDRLIRDMGQKGILFAKNHTWENITDQYKNYLIEIYFDFYKK